MVDILTLGLYALSANVKGKRERKQAADAAAAATAATQAEQQFELSKIDREQAAIANRERVTNIEKQTQYFYYQNPNDKNDVFAAPHIPGSKHPEGYDIVGTRTGAETKFQLTTQFNGDAPAVGTGLYTINGRVDTLKNHRKMYGAKVDLMPLNQVGAINKDGEYDIWSKEERTVGLGATEQQDIVVGNQIFSLSQAAEAEALGLTLGLKPQLRTREVLPGGKVIGAPTYSDTAGTQLRTQTRFNVAIPAKKEGETGEVISNLTDTQVNVELLNRGLRRDQVIISTIEEQIGPNNTIASSKVTNVAGRADVTREEQFFNARIGNIVFNNMSRTELESTAEEMGYDLADITYTPVTKKYKNGELISTIHGETKHAKEQKKHVAYVTGKDGQMTPVIAESKAALDRQFGDMDGYDYAGTANVRNEAIVGAVEAVEVEDIELTLEDGSTVLASEATPDDRMNAVGQRIVKINSDSGEITGTGTMSSAPISGIARDMNIGYKLNGVRHLGVKASLTPGDTLVKMHSKLDNDTLSELNAAEDTETYVQQAVPAIVQAISDINTEKQAVLPPGQQPLGGIKSSLGFVKQYYPQFLEVDGMREALIASDTIKLEETKGDVLKKVSTASAPGSLPVIVETSSNPDTMDEDNETGNFTSMGKDVSLVPTFVPPQHADFSATVLMPKILAINGNNTKKAQSSMFSLISFRREWDGTPIEKDGVLQPEVNQPLIAALQGFDKRKITIDGQEVSYLDMFISLANGENISLKEDDFRYFANQVIGASKSVTDAVEAVEQFIVQHPANLDVFTYVAPSVRDAAIANGLAGYGTSQTEQQFRADQQVIKSGARGIGIANKILETYYRPDGTMRQSSAVGDIVLGVEGLEYLAGEAMGLFRTALGGTDAKAIADAYLGSVDNLKQQVGLDTSSAGNAGRSQIEAIVSDIAADVAKAKDADSRALAARQFHIVTLAYELSATIQGGTGGRTISDQDVALILRALRQKMLASPESQVAVIQEAREMMRDIVAIAQLSTTRDAKKAAAFNLVQGLSAVADGGFHRNITPQSVAARFGAVQTSDAIPDETLLNSINLQRSMSGQEPYKSLDKVPEAEKTAFIGGVR